MHLRTCTGAANRGQYPHGIVESLNSDADESGVSASDSDPARRNSMERALDPETSLDLGRMPHNWRSPRAARRRAREGPQPGQPAMPSMRAQAKTRAPPHHARNIEPMKIFSSTKLYGKRPIPCNTALGTSPNKIAKHIIFSATETEKARSSAGMRMVARIQEIATARTAQSNSKPAKMPSKRPVSTVQSQPEETAAICVCATRVTSTPRAAARCSDGVDMPARINTSTALSTSSMASPISAPILSASSAAVQRASRIDPR
mmetsp:Transcript_88045/g.247482  ORF Transcript_88045/g.247482 Transcript_88045/m.247482 type:complete len:261 (-) Transcript_88045:1030-1812(-)